MNHALVERPRKIYKFQPIVGPADSDDYREESVRSLQDETTRSDNHLFSLPVSIQKSKTPESVPAQLPQPNPSNFMQKQIAKVMPISLNAPTAQLQSFSGCDQRQDSDLMQVSSQPIEPRTLGELKAELLESFDLHLNETDAGKKATLLRRIETLKRRIAELQNPPPARTSLDMKANANRSWQSSEVDSTPIDLVDDEMKSGPCSTKNSQVAPSKATKRKREDSDSSQTEAGFMSHLNDLIDQINSDPYDLPSTSGKNDSSNKPVHEVAVADFDPGYQPQTASQSTVVDQLDEDAYTAAYRPISGSQNSNSHPGSSLASPSAGAHQNIFIDDGESAEFRGENFPFSRAVRQQFTRRFGLRTFRRNQLEAINCALLGNDAFVLMPTGGGKSLCYQLPALITPGLTVVVSPLRSLIFDQVSKLEAMRIGAVQLNGDTEPSEYQMTYARLDSLITCSASNSRAGFDDVDDELSVGWNDAPLNRRSALGASVDCPLKLLYVTPEKIQASDRLIRTLATLYEHGLLDRFVIDEAHCVSAWGHDFRPDYKRLAVLRERFPKVPIMALTATATVRVRVDIVLQLGMHPIRRPGLATSTGRFTRFFIQSFNRANLKYSIAPKKSKTCVNDIIKLIKQDFSGKSGIVYCLTRKDCEAMAEALRAARIQALPYHAGLNNEKREAAQANWLDEAGCKVICATIAFGMGIDKPDVRFVIHYSVPKSVEGFYQESGRAGRDNLPATCVVFYSMADVTRCRKIIDMDSGTRETRSVHYENLARMTQFCENRIDCRRKLLLEYFGEQFDPAQCGRLRGCACDNCERRSQSELKRLDVTADAKEILQTIVRLRSEKQRPTLKYICDVLRGAHLAKIVERGHDRLSIFGLARSYARSDGDRLIHQLLALEVLVEEIETYYGFSNAYIKPGKRAYSLMAGQMHVWLDVSVENPINRTRLSVEGAPSTSAAASNASVNEAEQKRKQAVLALHQQCYERLVACAREVARARGVQNYAQLVSNDALRKLADQLPQSREAIMSMETFTAIKYARIDGDRFLDILKEHKALIELQEVGDQIVADFDEFDADKPESTSAPPSKRKSRVIRLGKSATSENAAGTSADSKKRTTTTNSKELPAPVRYRPELTVKSNAAISNGDDDEFDDSKYFGADIVNDSDGDDKDSTSDPKSKSQWMSKSRGPRRPRNPRSGRKTKLNTKGSGTENKKRINWAKGKQNVYHSRATWSKSAKASKTESSASSRKAAPTGSGAHKTASASGATSSMGTSHLLPLPIPRKLSN